MKSIVYTDIPPCDPMLVTRAAGCGVADLHEALGPITGRLALMSHTMKPLSPGRCIAGQAVTAFNYGGDNLMMHLALRQASRGQVVVTSNGGIPVGAQWGEMATLNAVRKDLAGVVVDGNIRDVDAIRRMEFPIWSTFLSPSHAEKRGPGAVNVPIICGGVLVEPGDVVVADGDGVLVVPLANLAEAVEGATKYAEREKSWRPRLTSDTDLFDLAGLQSAVEAAGVVVREECWADERRRQLLAGIGRANDS